MATLAVNAEAQGQLASNRRPQKRRRLEQSTRVARLPLRPLAPKPAPGLASSDQGPSSQPRLVAEESLRLESDTAIASDSFRLLATDNHPNIMDWAQPAPRLTHMYHLPLLQQLPPLQHILPVHQLPAVNEKPDVNQQLPIRLQPLVLPTGPFTFIHVDPTKPQQSSLETKTRSQAERDQQKEDAAALRDAGGSCMWCARFKKKCEVYRPCSHCDTVKQRFCIREAGHLYLFGSPPCSPFPATYVPSVEGRLALQEMERIVFSEKTDFELILSICQNNTFGPQALVVAKFDPNLREEETLVDPFIDMAIGCLNYAELSELEASYSNNSLVVMALKMAKLFITTRCMATTRMFAQTAHIASGRLVIFLVLIRCVRRLADMSWEFCLGTYQFLCHKVRVGYNPKIDKGLDPIWVATALYQRTACGLNDLRENPVIGKILGRMCNIHIICQVIKSILRDTYPRQKYLVKTKNCEALETEIPELSSSSSSFDIAFSQDASDIGKRIPLSPESYYAMATFISDGFPLSDSPLPSSSDAAGVLMDFCASQPAPMATTQDALGKPSVEHLDSTDAPHLPHGHNQILRVNTGSRSGSLETLKSTGSTETLPELPDTGPGDWTLDGLRMDFGPEIFGVLDSSSSSSFCSCCSFTCEHEPGTEGCCPYTDCSPGNCYCPQNGSPN